VRGGGSKSSSGDNESLSQARVRVDACASVLGGYELFPTALQWMVKVMVKVMVKKETTHQKRFMMCDV